MHLFQFKIEMIDSMYRLAKYRYECGNYVESASYLYFCQLVMNPTEKVRKLTCQRPMVSLLFDLDLNYYFLKSESKDK